MYKVSDFKKGETAYIEILNKSRKHCPLKECYYPCEITEIGDFVIAAGYCFEPSNRFCGALAEHTSFIPEVALWPTLDALTEKIEKENLVSEIKEYFSEPSVNLSLNELKQIKEIIKL